MYINLRHRSDRRQHMEEVTLPAMGLVNCRRLEAATHPRLPFLGCTQSHIQVCQQALVQTPCELVLVLEDDAQLQTPLDWTQIQTWFQTHRDLQVLMLAINPLDTILVPDEPQLVHVKWGLISSAYVVRPAYLPTLLQNFHEGYQFEIPLDVHWAKLQRAGGWYAVDPAPIIQKASYSDIEKRFVDYQV